MANNVYANVELQSANEEASKYFKEFSRLLGENHWSAFDFLFGSSEKTNIWMIENVGAKWLIVEDAEDDRFSTCTAWDSPMEMFLSLHEKLLELDENVKIWMTWEDEMPNFVGWRAYNGDDEESELFYQEHYNMFIEGWRDYEELQDNEDEEVADEIWDLQMENFWEDWSGYSLKMIQEHLE